MKIMGWITVGIVVGALVLYGAARMMFPSIKDDNKVEEIVEEVIKGETGLDIDLSPMTPEDK